MELVLDWFAGVFGLDLVVNRVLVVFKGSVFLFRYFSCFCRVGVGRRVVLFEIFGYFFGNFCFWVFVFR